MPIHAVRELDANSFIKLSNRPGRTIREKLAGKPHMQAVRRFQSVDLPENRLLKAFVRHLVELLEFRLDYLGHEDEILPKYNLGCTPKKPKRLATGTICHPIIRYSRTVIIDAFGIHGGGYRPWMMMSLATLSR